jgi:hypothetical protein
VRRLEALLCLAFALPAFAQPIQRSQAEVRAFRAENPCPATGQRRGPCPDWQVDHTIALVCGGPDTKENMQWLTIAEHRVKTRYDVMYCRRKRQ